MTVYGGIEGGGTKFVCALGTGPEDMGATAVFDTGTPDQTLSRAIAFFRDQREAVEHLDAIGIGMFGPVDLRRESPSYGRVLGTPKPGWSGADVLGPLRAALDIPLVIDTDVNAAALAEWRWGAARGCDPTLYITVGTGIGGGVIVHGRPLHGLLHPEMGHVPVRRHPADPISFAGICPFHGDCLEGLASGGALEERWGAAPDSLPEDHVAWDIQAYYLGQALASFVYTLSPERIVLGGGVMCQSRLLAKVRGEVQALLGGYVPSDLARENIDRYIVPPALGERAGVLGALALAQEAGEG